MADFLLNKKSELESELLAPFSKLGHNAFKRNFSYSELLEIGKGFYNTFLNIIWGPYGVYFLGGVFFFTFCFFFFKFAAVRNPVGPAAYKVACLKLIDEDRKLLSKLVSNKALYEDLDKALDQLDKARALKLKAGSLLVFEKKNKDEDFSLFSDLDDLVSKDNSGEKKNNSDEKK